MAQSSPALIEAENKDCRGVYTKWVLHLTEDGVCAHAFAAPIQTPPRADDRKMFIAYMLSASNHTISSHRTAKTIPSPSLLYEALSNTRLNNIANFLPCRFHRRASLGVHEGDCEIYKKNAMKQLGSRQWPGTWPAIQLMLRVQ